MDEDSDESTTSDLADELFTGFEDGAKYLEFCGTSQNQAGSINAF